MARLHIASWRASYARVLPAEYLAGLDPARRAAQWLAAIARPDVTVLVAADEEGLAGFTAAGPSRDEDLPPNQWHQLYNFHVDPLRRGRGIGGALWRAMVAKGWQGRNALTLWVVPANLGARRFYERQGLTADGVARTEELAPGVHLPEMRYRGPFP